MITESVFTRNLLVFAIAVLLISCKGKDPATDYPVADISDAAESRKTSDGTMRFNIYLSKAAENEVSVGYVLKDGTAIASKDFVAASGTVTIPAGQASGYFEVVIKGDPEDTRQANLQFTAELENPQLCKLGIGAATGTIITENGLNLATGNEGYSTPLSYPGYTLAWSDEFNGSSLDLSVWNQETGRGSNGWGNNELEFYTNSTNNTFVSKGNLVIEARKDLASGLNYTSGRMTTQGNKFFTFGRIDIRAKLPVGKGIWPALWMLGTNITTAGWPACGEIDIMELVGTYPSRVTGTMHWKTVSGNSTNKGANFNLSTGDFSQQFHVFSIVWEKDIIKWYVDDQLYLTNTLADVGAANYPFNAPHFFIFNVAVGGNWPGPPDGTTTWPQRMFVDYVRVFQ
ncbi:MAG: family 16 glycosylhydrolase [Bacteroidales bacterium]|jgi:beta-glucanase (GH16 family)|nr:family 16 glycosylhydrolase [Bacteroidales bacterium]